MGLFKFFKKMFKDKPIQKPKTKDGEFLVPLSNGYDTISLGQELQIDEDWSAVIVAKGKVLDQYPAGKHKLDLAYLPKTTKELALDKGRVEKKGSSAKAVLPDKFKCDLYFVFLGLNEKRTFQSDEIKIKSKEARHLRYYIRGNYTFQVEDCEKAIKLFLIDWGKIKQGRASKKLDYLLSEIVSDVLWTKKYQTKDEIVVYDFANVVLKPAVNKVFLKYGIVVTDMQAEKIVFPESFSALHYEEVFPEKDNLLEGKNTKLLNENQKMLPNSKPKTKKISKKTQKNVKKAETNNDFEKNEILIGYNDKQNTQKDSIDIDVKPADSFDVEINSEPTFNNVEIASENKKRQDLSKLYCKFCGTFNDEKSSVCKNCGKKL